jgi:hypothetical protein
MSTSRIPLFKVIEALKVAAARQRTRRAVDAVLVKIPMSDWQLRDAVRDIAYEADWAGFSRCMFSSRAIGGAA